MASTIAAAGELGVRRIGVGRDALLLIGGGRDASLAVDGSRLFTRLADGNPSLRAGMSCAAAGRTGRPRGEGSMADVYRR